MRRLVVAAALVGVVNGLIAALSVYLLRQARGDDFGWFAYAPLNDSLVPPSSPTPWELLLVPVILVALDVALVLVAARRRWLGTERLSASV
jgi:hypothetical protein